MLPSTGAMSLFDICDEFGVSRSTPLQSFYRGAGIVPNTSQNSSVPTAGAISFPTNFYGAGRALFATCSPTTIDLYASDRTSTLASGVTVTASRGRPGYAYSSSWSGSAGVTVTGGSTNTPSVTATGNGTNRTLSGTLQITVTDSLGATAGVNVPVSMTWGTT